MSVSKPKSKTTNPRIIEEDDSQAQNDSVDLNELLSNHTNTQKVMQNKEEEKMLFTEDKIEQLNQYKSETFIQLWLNTIFFELAKSVYNCQDIYVVSIPFTDAGTITIEKEKQEQPIFSAIPLISIARIVMSEFDKLNQYVELIKPEVSYTNKSNEYKICFFENKNHIQYMKFKKIQPFKFDDIFSADNFKMNYKSPTKKKQMEAEKTKLNQQEVLDFIDQKGFKIKDDKQIKILFKSLDKLDLEPKKK